ncbi:MAG TPA: hypothetical protein VFN65_13045 [Solirubrobacteraceae bacterium]|nr:hypothetical protein [Solirubrobacteraceae bacterium]
MSAQPPPLTVPLPPAAPDPPDPEEVTVWDPPPVLPPLPLDPDAGEVGAGLGAGVV